MTFPLTAAEQVRHYADIRARLMGHPRRAVPLLAIPAPQIASAPAPVAFAPVEDYEPPVVDNTPHGAPLNMLAPCSWKFLRDLAALRHGISVREIMSPSRGRPVVAARYEAMALVYQHSQLSLPQVGRLFKRDHTTVLHALRKVGATGKLVEAKEIPDLPLEPAPRRPKQPTWLQKAVKRAYANNVPPSALAEEYGCNVKSVKVIAHNLGLTRSKAKTDWQASA